ncbi:MAG: amidase family protein, partial [Chloroflexota bacterium]
MDQELHELSIAALQQSLDRSEVSSVEIVRHVLARIEELDRQGPALQSILQTNPDAESLARDLDAARGQGKVRGPLHGIPILLKDNIDTADAMETTAGSLALLDSKPERDAHVVERLRSAGAILLGKTNMSEWANFRSTKSTSGWSCRGGQARNPYVLDRSPCGSSSGSATAVAAGLAPVSLGTETSGSILCPASFNSVVGIKPTCGLTSRAGVIPIAHSQDTAGPMARTVTDAAILLGAMTGEDARDTATAASSGTALRDYTRFLDADGL